jgi:hypothetical protein
MVNQEVMSGIIIIILCMVAWGINIGLLWGGH